MAEQPDDRFVLAHASEMTRALERYRRTADRRALDEAFVEARAAAATLRGAGYGPADPREAPYWLVSALPAAAELADAAAGEAERTAARGLLELWRVLSLRTAAPRWTDDERAAARTAVLVAVTAPGKQSLDGMQAALRRIASARVAGLLADALSSAGELTWTVALGERYRSVAHRCAPRTRLRTLGLGAVVAGDPRVREALAARLADWLRRGALRDELPRAIEAVLVNYRTPDTVA